MGTTVTGIVLTKNEESHIAACLESLKWCDETLVIDDFSNDKTIDIARKYHAKVIQHPLQNDFSQQRNFGLLQAKNEWVLFVDADEIVSLSLQYEITNQVTNQFSDADAFYIRRIDEMWNKKLHHGEVGDKFLLRLAKKSAGQWMGKVHEIWKVKGNTQRLQNPLMHTPHQSVKEFLAEINFYSDLRAQELVEQHRVVPSWQVILYPIGKFIDGYIVKAGAFDGIAGLMIAIMMSFYTFLARGKAYLLYESKEKR